MNEEDRGHFDDLIIKAVQSGKQETSGLMMKINERLESNKAETTTAVENAVDKKINGKLSGLKEDNNQIKKHLADQDKVLLSIKLWRAYNTGALAVIIFIILPIMGFIATQVIKQGNQVSAMQVQIKLQTK